MTEDLILPLITLAKQTGEKILTIYNQASPQIITIKSDNSPFTEADLIAHQLLSEGLKQLIPELPVLSEESANISFVERKHWQRYWLLDPLDGTQEFINKTNDFTINIALIENGRPILGILYAPVFDLCYFAAENYGAFKQEGKQAAMPIHTANYQGETAKVVGSRRHGLEKLNTFLQNLKNYALVSRGSALKFGLVAEGLVDTYPRLSPTSEWDTAAGQCIVEQAGGKVVAMNGTPLLYNTKESLLNPMFLAVGDKNFDWLRILNFNSK